ncbi:hypothetical protein HK096_011657 [Nowakowskiella sp. JEL0078]|nr:hypothetical protein HK096_011657 [Nowakowskiella sp. JEL0078]
MQERIREAVVKEMTDWFVRVREQSPNIGRQAQSNQLFQKHTTSENIIKKSSFTSIGEDDGTDGKSNLIQIDMKPLYQCLHIHDVLGRRLEFQLSFEENRKAQANLVLSSSFSLQEENLKGFTTYLHEVIGFFVVESVVLNSTHEFRARGNVQSLPPGRRIMGLVSFKTALDPDRYLSIKLLVIQLTQTLEKYGYNVDSLRTLLVSLFDKYSQLLRIRCCNELQKVVEMDEYCPLIVASSSEFDNVLSVFKIPEEKRTTLRYPKSMTFSRGFLKYCDLIRSFVIGFYKFAEGFEQQHNEMDDLVKKSLESILTSLADALSTQITQNNLSQAVQIILNFEFLEIATITLHATHSFREVSKVAEKRIFELVNLKIDAFLELASYEWLVLNNESKINVFKDLSEYLTTVVSSTLDNLPQSIRSYVYFDAFGHLASKLMDLLLDPKIKKITLPGVESFSNDLTFLETFVGSKVETSNLVDNFTELRQTLNLLMSENMEEILNPSIKSKKYSRVQSINVITVLEKYTRKETP